MNFFGRASAKAISKRDIEILWRNWILDRGASQFGKLFGLQHLRDRRNSHFYNLHFIDAVLVHGSGLLLREDVIENPGERVQTKLHRQHFVAAEDKQMDCTQVYLLLPNVQHWVVIQ